MILILISDIDMDYIGVQQKIVLLEELPSFVYRGTIGFHSLIKQYQNYCCTRNGFPLVIIQSESKSAGLGTKEDPLRKLFPPELLLENLIHHIQFNAASATNMTKALTNIAMIVFAH